MSSNFLVGNDRCPHCFAHPPSGYDCRSAFKRHMSTMTHPSSPPAPMTAAPDTRPPVEHELKTWASYFHALVAGTKTFELRRDDRGFRVGDTLRLRETDYSTGAYTGRELTRRITHILRHEADLGLMDGFCILSLESELAAARKELETESDEPTQAIVEGAAQLDALYTARKVEDGELGEVLRSINACLPDVRSDSFFRETFERAADLLTRLSAALKEAERLLTHRTKDMQRWIDHHDARADAAEAKLESARRDALEEAAKWHDDRYYNGPDAFEMEFHKVSASAIRALQTKDTTPP